MNRRRLEVGWTIWTKMEVESYDTLTQLINVYLQVNILKIGFALLNK